MSYREINRMQYLAGIINEIKVNNPDIKLPIIVNKNEYDTVSKILKIKGYTWAGGRDLISYDPWMSVEHKDFKVKLFKNREADNYIYWDVVDE